MPGICEGARCALALGDDALILGHRLSEWCGHAPMLEEDMALANIGLDLIGQARLLYGYAGAASGLSEDQLAYFRDAPQFRNLLICELPNGDFARTMLRQYFFSAYAVPMWQAMTDARDLTLAAIAAKAVKECAYHLRHSAEWVIRLGDGTPESHARIAAALELLWPYTGEMFEANHGMAVDLAGWTAAVSGVLTEAGLQVPASNWMQSGGRQGRHSEHLGHLLAEMQFLQRAYPGAEW